MSKAKKQLRFAALIRVSTEKQEKQGESLSTQRSDNEASVEQVGGSIVAWYGGQEHATPGHEKKDVDRLIHDAQQGRFDAVIVAHADRWSRDNGKSREGLEVFRQREIRFFVRSFEYDLFNPQHRFYLGMSAEIGQLQASTQNEKSIRNRIHRAKRGLPTTGKLPFGRTFDKRTGQWGIDPDKQAMVEDVANRYLAGEPLSKLAEEYGHNHSNLHKILNKRCGDSWQQTFDCDDLNIHEAVNIPIPRLLSEKAIKAIRHQAEANRTYLRGQQKHRYLFKSLVFCAHCGKTMSGQTNHNGHRYYRHPARTKCVRSGVKAWVNADSLEAVVMRHLFDCFGNAKAVQRAIEEATPNKAKVNTLLEIRQRLEGTLAKFRAARGRIVQAVGNGTLTEEEVEDELAKLRRKEVKLQTDLYQIGEQLGNLPTPEAIKAISKQVSRKFVQFTDARLIARMSHLNDAFDEMTWDERRGLAEMVFSGKTAAGKRMGVYIEWTEGQEARRRKRWRYTLSGHLIHDSGQLPMSKVRMEAVFSVGCAYMQKGLVSESALCCTAPALPSRRFSAPPARPAA